MPPKEDPKIDSRETLCWQTFLEKARYQAIDILVGFRIHGRSLWPPIEASCRTLLFGKWRCPCQVPSHRYSSLGIAAVLWACIVSVCDIWWGDEISPLFLVKLWMEFWKIIYRLIDRYLCIYLYIHNVYNYIGNFRTRKQTQSLFAEDMRSGFDVW